MTPGDAVDPRHDEDRDGGPEVARRNQPREHHHVRKVANSGITSTPRTWVPARIRIRGAKGEWHVRGMARWPLAVHRSEGLAACIGDPVPWTITHQPSGFRLVPLCFRTEAGARAFADDLLKRAGAPGFAIRNPAAHPELVGVVTKALRARGCSMTLHPNPGGPA